jgi:hypothetical protein
MSGQIADSGAIGAAAPLTGAGSAIIEYGKHYDRCAASASAVLTTMIIMGTSGSPVPAIWFIYREPTRARQRRS